MFLASFCMETCNITAYSKTQLTSKQNYQSDYLDMSEMEMLDLYKLI